LHARTSRAHALHATLAATAAFEGIVTATVPTATGYRAASHMATMTG
jgi:hypothetical protein